MKKKFFTLLLVAVFALAQFSAASAAVVAGDASITAIPDFANATNVDVDWAVTGMAGPSQNILMWSRIQQTPAVAYGTCRDVAAIGGTSDANGTFTYTLPVVGNGNVVELLITVEDTNCAGAAAPANTEAPMADTTVDSAYPMHFMFNPPSTALASFNTPVACNTFEMWALGSDHFGFPSNVGYSGLGSWNQSVTGTFAVPAPIGPAEDLLSWPYTFPATASGPWTFSIYLEDVAGNNSGGGPYTFRNGAVLTTVSADEVADCVDFPDVGGHADELYIRYLATLGLISGFADGSFGPDATLTRAEASALIEISNGYDPTTLPTSAPAGCDFTDVAASDWFAGWVWQACDDGYMNGVGGGLFDPNNLLTRGQIVTILNNVANASPVTYGGFIDTLNVVGIGWGLSAPFPFRNAAWADVSIGAYYAEPVIQAYGWGVAEGTSATTFSPDQPVTRGEFAKMLYRALSRL